MEIFKHYDFNGIIKRMDLKREVHVYSPSLSDIPLQAAGEIFGLYFDIYFQPNNIYTFDEFQFEFENALRCYFAKDNFSPFMAQSVSNDNEWAACVNSFFTWIESNYAILCRHSMEIYLEKNQNIVLAIKKQANTLWC